MTLLHKSSSQTHIAAAAIQDGSMDGLPHRKKRSAQ